MPTTGVLGSSFATLGSLTLGASPVLGDIVERTQGLVALWKCDDPPGSTFLAGINNLHNAVLAQGTVPFERVPGIDDYAISTPVATKLAGDHEYDTARHLKFATTGGPIDVGDAGTIELWFKPFEFTDEVAPGKTGSDGTNDFEIFRLDSAATGTRIRFMTGWVSQIGPFNQLLRVNFTQPGYNAPGDGVWDAFADSGRDGTGFWSYTGHYPPCEAGRWYYLAFTWDQTGYEMYLNGVKIPNGNTGTAHPPPGLNDCDVSFGQSGGLYDLVSISNRRLPGTAFKYRYDPGAATAPTASEVYLTSYLVSYVAGYQTDARVTSLHAEVLRTGARNARVTQNRVEVLRTVEASPVYTPYVAQTLTYRETASGVATPATPPRTGAASQTLAPRETATAEVYAPRVVTVSARDTLAVTQTPRRVLSASAGDTLAARQTATPAVGKFAAETLTVTETVDLEMTHDRRLLQSLAIAQSTALQADRSELPADTLTVTETAVIAHEITRGTLQLLAVSETAAAEVSHVFDRAVSDALVFSETAALQRGKEGAAADRLLLVDGVRLHRTFWRHAGDTLALTDSAARGPMELHRGASDTLAFYAKDIPVGAPLVIDGKAVVITRPAAQIVRAARSVTLLSRRGAVVLPVPLLGDADEGRDQVSVKRTMTGLYYTYVRTNPARVLSYDFELTRRKALELRAFVQGSHSLLVDLTNWRGEQYAGYVLNNPVEFTSTSRYAGSFEKVTVTINYEGVRVN